MDHGNENSTPLVNPNEKDYIVLPKQKYHRGKVEVLGIEETLLAPRPPSAPIIAPRSLKEFRGWRPIRMRFTRPWPSHELSSGWFELLYTDLTIRMKALAGKYFEFGNIPHPPPPPPSSSPSSPWLQGFSDDFVRYAGLTARQDNQRGGWDTLLLESATRRALVLGIIAKVLEAGVFDKLLFGASEAQQKMLETQDKATVEIEGKNKFSQTKKEKKKGISLLIFIFIFRLLLGYQRTELRACSVRTCLAGDTIPPNFWPAVDELTMQLMTMLLPLLDLVDKHFPKNCEHSARQVHQDLHDIVAEAGFFSIAIRWSKTIFRFTAPAPGEYWELDQRDAEPGVFAASKAAAEKEWEQTRDRRTCIPDAVPAAAHGSEPNGGTSTTGGQQQAGYSRPMLVAKVQIVQWPQLERWAPYGSLERFRSSKKSKKDEKSEKSDDDDDDDDEVETITRIMDSHVAYYTGVANDAAEAAEAIPSLEHHVRDLKMNRIRRRAAKVLLVILAVSLLIIPVVVGAILVTPGVTWMPFARTQPISKLVENTQAGWGSLRAVRSAAMRYGLGQMWFY